MCSSFAVCCHPGWRGRTARSIAAVNGADGVRIPLNAPYPQLAEGGARTGFIRREPPTTTHGPPRLLVVTKLVKVSSGTRENTREGSRPARGRLHASIRWSFLASTLAAVVVLTAACGGSSSDNGAKVDATAACQALARSTGKLSPLTLSVGYRLTGAGNLGLAAAGEDSVHFGNLSNPMKAVQNDVSTNATGAISGDVGAALGVCKADKLPST
jgi:hypothetical protein